MTVQYHLRLILLYNYNYYFYADFTQALLQDVSMKDRTLSASIPLLLLLIKFPK